MAHVSRSTYYKWASGKISQRVRVNERLAKVVEKIYCSTRTRVIAASKTPCVTTTEFMSTINVFSGFAGKRISNQLSNIASQVARGAQKIRNISPEICLPANSMHNVPTRNSCYVRLNLISSTTTSNVCNAISEH